MPNDRAALTKARESTDTVTLAPISPAQRDRWIVTLRVLGAIFGGYAFTAASVALLSVALPMLGMARSEAVILASMLGFVAYVGLLIWAFAEPRLSRVWAVLAGGALLAYVLMRALKMFIA